MYYNYTRGCARIAIEKRIGRCRRIKSSKSSEDKFLLKNRRNWRR